jgi:hypothetical protein
MARPPAPRSDVNRARLLELIDSNPLRFFALALILVDGMLAVVAALAGPQNQIYLFGCALLVFLATIGAVLYLAVRPTAEPVDMEVLADRVSEDIWFSMDGALGNLESLSEQAKAWVSLIRSVSTLKPGEAKQRSIEKFRSAFVAGIKARAGKGQPRLKQEINRFEAIPPDSDQWT